MKKHKARKMIAADILFSLADIKMAYAIIPVYTMPNGEEVRDIYGAH